jgi:rod shape-determining protein MreD
MILETIAIGVGIVISFFLKDINFLGLNIAFLNTGLVYPDFLLIFLIFFAMYRGEFAGLWIGFFTGILEDSGMIQFSSHPLAFVNILGVHSLIYTLTGFFLGKLSRYMDRNSTLPIIAVTFVTAFVVRLMTWIVMGVVAEFNHSFSFLSPAIYTAAVSPIWFFILGWAYRSTIQEEK